MVYNNCEAIENAALETKSDRIGEMTFATKKKLEIAEGLAQGDRGYVFSHGELMAKYRKYGRVNIED